MNNQGPPFQIRAYQSIDKPLIQGYIPSFIASSPIGNFQTNVSHDMLLPLIPQTYHIKPIQQNSPPQIIHQDPNHIRIQSFNAQKSLEESKYHTEKLNNNFQKQKIQIQNLGEQMKQENERINKRLQNIQEGMNPVNQNIDYSYNSQRTPSTLKTKPHHQNHPDQILLLQNLLESERKKFSEAKSEYDNRLLEQEKLLRELKEKITYLAKFDYKTLQNRVKQLESDNQQLKQENLQLKIKQKSISILQKVGGQQHLNEVLNSFYLNAQKDERLNDYFKNVNIQQQKHDLKNYLLYALEQGVDPETNQKIKNILEEFRDQQLEKLSRVLYERLGGHQTISVAVEVFYDKVMSDQRVQHFFQNVNMTLLRQHQKDFIIWVTGGSQIYKGKDLRKAHQHLQLKDHDFDIITQYLIQSFKSLGIDRVSLMEFSDLLLKTRTDCLNLQEKQDSVLKTREVEDQQSIYSVIGGLEMINSLVDLMYNKALSDQRLKKCFDSIDIEKFSQLQKDLMITQLGGPQVYFSLNSMKINHEQILSLDKQQFEILLELLFQSLNEQMIDQILINQIFQIISPLDFSEDISNEKTELLLQQQQQQIDQNQQLSLFERLGGQEAINATVDLFYDKVLEDKRVNHFFKNSDIKKQRQQQKDFMTTVFGGPQIYKGKSLKIAHQHLNIKSESFDIIFQLLVESLTELGVQNTLIDEVGAILESTRKECVSNVEQIIEESLYERLGGYDTIDVVVDRFYERVLEDNRVNHFFSKTDMKQLKQKQNNFMTMVFGGENIYNGKDMKEAHKHLNLQGEHFDIILQILLSTFQELGVDSIVIKEIKTIVESTRSDCLSQKSEHSNLFTRLGGQEAINAVVDRFYDKVLQNYLVKHFFSNTDMQQLRQQQKDFITTICGGPQLYKGKDMHQAHQNLELQNIDFDNIVNILVETLNEFNIDQTIINEVVNLLETTRNQIVLNQNISNNEQQQQQSLYEKLGGQDAINAVVDRFYEKVLGDKRVKNFFINTDMEKQRFQQKQFISQVFGGPQLYKGKDMKNAHQHLKLQNKDFDAIVDILVETFNEFKIQKDLIQEVTNLLETTRKQIVID